MNDWLETPEGIHDSYNKVASLIGDYEAAKDRIVARISEIERLNIEADEAKEFQQSKLAGLRYALHLLP